jgi:hypothetical protein
MQHHPAFTQLRHGSDTLLLWLIPLVLLVDCVSGAIAQLSGSNIAISAVYKLALISLMALSWFSVQPKYVFGLLALLGAMLLGPALHWQAIAPRWALADLQLALKAISPLLAFGYLLNLAQRMPEHSLLLFRRTIFLSALVLLLNMLLGLSGYGFSAYQPLEGVAQSFLGIKGFFYSPNELSAVLLVLTAALLVVSWPKSKVLYVLTSTVALCIALLLLTKTGVFGVLLLAGCIPLLMQENVFWQRKKRGLMFALLLAVILLLLLVLNGETLLKYIGIYDKLHYVYQQRGISGILLSSRDYYATQIWHSVTTHYADWQQVFGVGQGGVALYLKKYFAELDWFDLFIFYGVGGLAVFTLTFGLFLRVSWQQRNTGAGRCLLLLNVLLLLVASLAGHILTSGMLWLPWALCNALLVQNMMQAQKQVSPI